MDIKGLAIAEGLAVEVAPCVYIIEKKDTGQKYVGRSKNVAMRLRAHVNGALRVDDKRLYRAMRKHGIEKFFVSLIAYVQDDQSMVNLEQIVIEGNESNREFGYNSTGGGEDITRINQEVIDRRRQTLKKTLASKEAKQKKSEISKRMWAQRDAEYRKRFGEKVAASLDNPEFKKSQSEHTKRLWENSEYASKMRSLVLTEEQKENHKKAMRKAMQDPVKRVNILRGLSYGRGKNG